MPIPTEQNMPIPTETENAISLIRRCKTEEGWKQLFGKIDTSVVRLRRRPRGQRRGRCPSGNTLYRFSEAQLATMQLAWATGNLRTRGKVFDDLWAQLCAEGKPVIVVGDFEEHFTCLPELGLSSAPRENPSSWWAILTNILPHRGGRF